MSLSHNEIKALPAGTIVTAATMAGGTKRVATAIATVGHRWSVSGNTYPMGDRTLSETYTDIEPVRPSEPAARLVQIDHRLFDLEHPDGTRMGMPFGRQQAERLGYTVPPLTVEEKLNERFAYLPADTRREVVTSLLAEFDIKVKGET